MLNEASGLQGSMGSPNETMDLHAQYDISSFNVDVGTADGMNDSAGNYQARNHFGAGDLNEEEMAARVLACKGRDVSLGEMEKVKALCLSDDPLCLICLLDAPKCECAESDA